MEMAILKVVDTGLERSPIMNQSLQIHRIPIHETVNRPTHLEEEARPNAIPVANNDFKAAGDSGEYNSYFLKAKAVAAMKKNSGESNRMYLEMVTYAFSTAKQRVQTAATHSLTPEDLKVK